MKIIELRELDALEEYAKLQEIIWGIGKQDILPTHLMKVYVDPDNCWGILLGALMKIKKC